MNVRRRFSRAAEPPPPPPVARTTTRRGPSEALLRRVDWEIVRKLSGRLQGDYRSGAIGDGLDVADLREYQVEDDVRRIDWNVTARMAEPFVRQYDEDREVTAWFVIDRSASMHFGHSERTKEVVASEIVIALARVLSYGGNRVGAVLWNNGETRVLQPRTGQRHLLHLAAELVDAPASSEGVAGHAPLENLLEAGAFAARRRSMIFVISDFLGPTGWELTMRRLVTRHDVVAVRIVDSQETTLPNAGLVVVQDAETGEQLTVDTSDRRFRERFAEAAAGREIQLKTMAARAGIDFFPIDTEADLADALLKMVAQRKERARA